MTITLSQSDYQKNIAQITQAIANSIRYELSRQGMLTILNHGRVSTKIHNTGFILGRTNAERFQGNQIKVAPPNSQLRQFYGFTQELDQETIACANITKVTLHFTQNKKRTQADFYIATKVIQAGDALFYEGHEEGFEKYWLEKKSTPMLYTLDGQPLSKKHYRPKRLFFEAGNLGKKPTSLLVNDHIIRTAFLEKKWQPRQINIAGRWTYRNTILDSISLSIRQEGFTHILSILEQETLHWQLKKLIAGMLNTISNVLQSTWAALIISMLATAAAISQITIATTNKFVSQMQNFLLALTVFVNFLSQKREALPHKLALPEISLSTQAAIFQVISRSLLLAVLHNTLVDIYRCILANSLLQPIAWLLPNAALRAVILVATVLSVDQLAERLLDLPLLKLIWPNEEFRLESPFSDIKPALIKLYEATNERINHAKKTLEEPASQSLEFCGTFFVNVKSNLAMLTVLKNVR